MYKVQNITKRPIKFQGIEIAPYGTQLYPQITDYITLSRLTNSGKIFYASVPNPKPVEVKEEVKAVEETPVIKEEVQEVKEVVEEVEKEEPKEEKKDPAPTQKRNAKKRKTDDAEEN